MDSDQLKINAEVKEFLDEKVIEFNTPSYIDSDPISIPHQFELKEDIEIAAFLTSTIAWGKRNIIIRNAQKMMDLMGNSPYDFIMEHNENQLGRLDGFVHRTFNAEDFKYFIQALRHMYTNHGGLESVFEKYITDTSVQPAINQFKRVFFSIEHPIRTMKHIGDPLKGSAAKKINMYLRWMCRRDNCGVDFGIWKSIPTSILSCPLDVHSGNVARKLGLLNRKQNDAKALAELDKNLRFLDPIDPVKYDFALFGLGVFEGF